MGFIFTLLMTYGGSLVAIFRPFNGFLIYVCFSLIRPESLWHWSVPAGNYSRTIAIAFLLGWLLSGLGNWALGRAGKPAVSLGCFLGWALISTLFCDFPAAGFTFLDNMSKIVLPAIAGLTLINTRRELYQLSWTIVASFGYVAYDFNMSYFSGFNRLQFAGFGGMDNNSITIGLVAGVGFAFFLGLSESVGWRRYLAFAAAAFMTHAVFFSFSRGGMLGLCVVGVATAILIPKTRMNITWLSLGVVIALSMAGPEVVERFSSVTRTSVVGADAEEIDSSAESRIDLWRICLQMVQESPILGKGPDHFPLLVSNYPVDGNYFPPGKEAHSLWMQIAAELGLPGAAFLFLFYGLTMRELWKETRMDKLDGQGLTPGACARMVCVALTGFMVSAQFVSLEGLEIPYYICVVGLGSLKIQSAAALLQLQAAQQVVSSPAVGEVAQVA